MATLKNKQKAGSTSRKRKSSIPRIVAIVVLAIFICFFLFAGIYFFFVFDETDAVKSFFEQRKNIESSVDNGPPKKFYLPHDDVDKQRAASPNEKAKFNAPEYQKKDKDYLDKIIQTR